MTVIASVARQSKGIFSMASVQDKLKAELMVEVYASIDRIYDSIEQHFELDETRRSNVIQSLNTLKDELYFVVKTTPLS
jgi:hypothetical protein